MTDITAISLAAYAEANRMLAVLEQRNIEPQVAVVGLMLAAATLIGRVAVDQRNLHKMSTAMHGIFAARAHECFLQVGTGTNVRPTTNSNAEIRN